eukprot:CAMPEP_0171458226 /NCGR_PEP_ID=MMETSP0945-20130129/3991_1 /TAXON_ID=109269 /ORGANISM="Vaucheria litorea, Strain CCMP2940" /LENGTH=392 /DNA_ID=CAMNT_0011983995 /DNA_START=137 /DNA_END=1315 /DNA_ORIENTATION=+
MNKNLDEMQYDEWDMENKVQRLESRIRTALKENRYDEATRLRDALARLQIDDAGAVLSVNSAFYSAFSKKSREKMAELWLNSDHVLCIHPGQEPIFGYSNVITTWTKMFSSIDPTFVNSVVGAKKIKINVKGTFAWVTCIEEVRASIDQPPSRTLIATNVFVKTRGRWWMVHHHASQGHSSGQNGKSETLDGMQNLSQLSPTLRYIKPGELSSLISDGGMTGEQSGIGKLGTMKDVLEALSDLLNEGNNSDDEVADVDMDVQFIRGLQGENSSLSSNAIGKFNIATPGLQGPEAHGISIVEDDKKGDSNNLARKTVEAVRRLCREGKINEKEKIHLITDIVKHATEDEVSMVEVAYELLIGHDNEDMADIGRVEDFVDQCKSFTEGIRDSEN